jgi:hypothetical protein
VYYYIVFHITASPNSNSWLETPFSLSYHHQIKKFTNQLTATASSSSSFPVLPFPFFSYLPSLPFFFFFLFSIHHLWLFRFFFSP